MLRPCSQGSDSINSAVVTHLLPLSIVFPASILNRMQAQVWYLLLAALCLAANAQSKVSAGNLLQLWPCDQTTGRQSWTYNSSGSFLFAARGAEGLVWDIEGPHNVTLKGLQITPAGKPPGGDQQWRFNSSTGQIASFWGQCVGTLSGIFWGSLLALQLCDTSDPTQARSPHVSAALCSTFVVQPSFASWHCIFSKRVRFIAFLCTVSVHLCPAPFSSEPGQPSRACSLIPRSINK